MMNKFNNLPELFYFQADKNENNQHLLKLDSNNQVISMSWLETKNLTKKIHNFLANKYLDELERVLLVSENRPEWMASDIAIMSNKLICVPNYTTYTSRDFEHILNDSQPVGLIVSNKNLLQTILIASEKVKYNFKFILCFDYFENNSISNLVFLNDLTDDNNDNNREKIKEIKRTDPACIIYTSGTQGNPKGVMLSHGGILSNCEGALFLLKEFISKKARFLTWLPLSHSYEHTVQFVQIALGARVFYAESIDKLIKNMGECNPDIMTAVPRFYQNLYQKINASFNKTKGLKKYLINKMLSLGEKVLFKNKLSNLEKVQNIICEKLVRKKIKAQFGGSLKLFISGGGALDKDVGVFLNAIGLPTLQGYGLTETSPVVSCNPKDDIRIDTVGPAFTANEVKIADDGEILVKGENVMLGYWNNEEETKKVLNDGWLSTGDIGHFENNYLKITDRKKDILITPGGDNISPIKIENDLLKIDFVEQTLVYGDNKPYLVALLVLNKEKSNILDEIILKELEIVNKNLSKIEKIKKFIVIKDQFTIENGLITPTLKLKRYKIIQKYKNELENLY